MAQVIVTESALQNIAGAIRSKLGTQDTYKPSEMAGAIAQIHGDPVLEALTVNANGTYTPSSGKDGFSQAVVNVPNSYSSGDEGKVVSNGALVAQSSQSINANGTYDTTLKNQVNVSVPNSYSASDEGKVVSNGALVAQSSQSITDNGTYDTTLKNQVVVNVSGGGGGILFYDIGGYFGDEEGSLTTSLNFNTSGHVGDKAILIVMHRDTITVDNSWTLIHKYANPSDSTYTITQFISVYEKIITSSAENYTIQQASSGRICACLLYVSADASLQYDSDISMDGSKSTYTFYVPKKNKYTLCVMSCVFAGNTTTSISPTVAVNSKTPIENSATRRMLAFIHSSLSTLTLETQSNVDAASLFYNRIIIFKISI